MGTVEEWRWNDAERLGDATALRKADLIHSSSPLALFDFLKPEHENSTFTPNILPTD
jgi:hypothetical protein